MAEKDPKKIDEKAGTQTNTVQLTPEMTLFLSTLTNTFSTIQQNFGASPTPTTEPPPKEFSVEAKAAVEKFNDILAGLALQPPLTPALNPLASNANPVQLKWNMPAQVDDLDGFQIQRAIAPGDQFSDLGPELTAEKRDYSDGPVPVGSTYRYRVVALSRKRGRFVSNVQEVQIS